MDLRTLSSNGAIAHKNKMFNFYLEQELVDTEVILSDGSIKVHGIVLATESKLACELIKSLPGPSRILKWTQFSKEVMRLVLEYIYRGTVTYPKQLETQINSLTQFLQLDGISIKKEYISTKFKIESFGTTNNWTKNKPEEEVIEISDEECSINTIISHSPTTSSHTKIIPEAPIDKIQHQTNYLLCNPVSQNQDQCKPSDENLSDSTFYQSLSGNEIKSADNIESIHIESAESKIDCKPTEKSPDLLVLLEECSEQYVLIPPTEKDAAITNKPLEANNTNNSTFLSVTSDNYLSIPPKENDFAIPSQPLEANNTSNSTFLSLTPNTCLTPQRIQFELLKKQILGEDEYFPLPLDDSLPNLRSNKNPYAKMVKKNVRPTKKILNFLTEPKDQVIQDVLVGEPSLSKEVKEISGDLQVNITEESTRNATNQNNLSKISIISQHIITTSNQEEQLPPVSIRKDQPGNSNEEKSHNLQESLDSSPPAPLKDSKNKCHPLPFNKEQIPTQTSKKRKTEIKRRLDKLGNKHSDQEKNNSKPTKLSRKYCLLCDNVENNFRIHLQYVHKEVYRKAVLMCEKCYAAFYYEFFKHDHNCE